MDEKSQISKIDNDDLRNFEQGFRRYFNENYPSVIQGGGRSILSRRLLGGVKRVHKGKRGRPRQLAPRIKNRLTKLLADRLSERIAKPMIEELEFRLNNPQLDFHPKGLYCNG